MEKVQAITNNHLKDLVRSEINIKGPNCDLNHIDTTHIDDFSGVFADLDFNGDFSDWNTSNGKKFDYMFLKSTYNGPLRMDTSKAQSMIGMFSYSRFNHPSIVSLNLRNVTDFSGMFAWSDFNQPIDELNPLNGMVFTRMFAYSKFNQNLDKFFAKCYNEVVYLNDMLVGTKFTAKLPQLHLVKKSFTQGMLAGTSLGSNIKEYAELSSSQLVAMFEGE